MKADDFGGFHGDPRIVESICYPLGTTTDVTQSINELEARGLVAFHYHLGRRYLTITNFGQRLRHTTRKFPDPATSDGIESDNILPQSAAKCGQPRLEVEEKRSRNEVEEKRKVAVAPVVIPQPLDCEEFKTAWDAYLSYRKESKFKTLKPTSINRQLDEMSTWGVERSIQAINTTITKGWQGVFEPTATNGSRKPTPALATSEYDF
jgi:hypothetical protein